MNEVLTKDQRKQINRWWWRFTWSVWKAIGVQAKQWRSSRLYVITILCADALDVKGPEAPDLEEQKPKLVRIK